MPSFEVTAASREITLDEADGRRGRVRFNVLNVAGGARTCRFIVNPAGGAEAGWFRIEGEQERTLQPNTSTDVDLAVEVPADATPGERRVRVDVAEVSAPEEDWTRGQDLRFTVPEIETEPNRFPWIPVAAAALLVLVLAGGLTWYFTRERTVELADVVGRSADEARAALEDAGFSVTTEIRETDSAPPNQVIDQTPDPGAVAPDTTVTLVVATAPAFVCAQDPLRGEWVNVDPNTRGVTRLLLTPRCEDRGERAGTWTLRMFGSCTPTDCDWGDTTARLRGGTFTAAYDQGFVVRDVTIEPQNGRLEAVIASDYRDNRTDRTATYEFQKP